MNRIIVTVGMMIALASANVLSQMNTIQLRNGSNTTTILPSASTTIAVQIPALSAGTHYLLTSTTNPGSSGAAGSLITYGTSTPQNTTDISATNHLFNIGYSSTVVEQNAQGGLILSTATGTNKSATALTLSATGTGTGTSTALYITNGRITLTDSDDSHITSFTTGNQTADINYTLPTADGTSGQVLSTNASGVLSWVTRSSVTAIDDLSDAKSGGTGFDSSILLGHQTTGAISGADPAAYNSAIGYEALQAITTGDQNVGFGHRALKHATSGSYNVAIGANAGYDLTTATYNVFIGLSAGQGVKTGSNNVAIGWGVLMNSTSGANNNVGIGDRALYSGISGNDNVGVGPYTLHSAGAASKNVVLGSNAGQLTTTGSNNVMIGFEAGKALTTGTGNILIGYQAGLSLTTTSDGLYIDNSSTSTPLIQGDFSANTLTFNAASVTIGDGSATAGEVRFREPSGANYSAFKAAAQTSDITYTLPQSDGTNGQVLSTNGSGTLTWATATSVAAINDLTDAIKNITDFSNSMIIGHDSTGTLSTANNNTAVGVGAMKAITSGDDVVALGYSSLKSFQSGNQIVSIGSGAMQAATSATRSVAVGYQAGYNVTTGEYSVFVGSEAGKAYTTGGSSVGIGYRSLLLATGNHNVGIGLEALSGVTTGTNNVAVGSYAGSAITTGTGNVILGYSAGPTTNGSGKLYIHNSQTNAPLIYGDFSANTLTFNGATTTTGNVTVGGGASASEIRFLEPSGSGSNYTAFKAAAQTSDITYTLPQSDGTNGQVLSTNGSGTLTWATATSVAAINDLTDAVKGIANFSNSMILGHELTGTLSSADNNTAVGVASMQAITSGDQNVALGYASLAKVTSGSQNTAVGNTAGNEITTGTQNVCLGHEAGYGIEDGTNNIAIGYGVYRNGAINASNVGSYNIGIGGRAMYVGPSGNSNIAIGYDALFDAADATANVSIGHLAGGDVTSGDNNVLIGYQAGATLTTGSGNVFIGYQTGSGVAVGTSNTLMISNSNDATPLVQGDFSANTLTFNGATTTTGNVTIGGTTTYTAPASSKTVTATTSTGASAPDIASFTNTYEKVTVTADGAAAGFVQLPTGTEGQIVYVRFLFSGSQTVTIVNSNTAASNTAMVFDGATTTGDVIVAHMLYTGTAEGWVVFSALEYDN